MAEFGVLDAARECADREDAMEQVGVLDADDRVTCSTCRTWATEDHLMSMEHERALNRAAREWQRAEWESTRCAGGCGLGAVRGDIYCQGCREGVDANPGLVCELGEPVEGFRHIIQLRPLNGVQYGDWHNYSRICNCGWTGTLGESHPRISIEDAIASV